MYTDLNTVTSNVTGVDAIKNSIKNILLTPKGSLPGKPNFGSDLYKVIFQPMDFLTVSMVKNYIEEALSEFEDRITIKNIDVKSVEEYNKIVIDIYFSYKNTTLTGASGSVDASTSIAVNV